MPDDPQILADKALVAGVLAGLAEPVNDLLARAEAQARRLIRRNFPAAHRDDLVNGYLEHLWRDDWRVLRHWRGEAPLANYLATVFRNLQLDRLEALRRDSLPGGASSGGSPADGSPPAGATRRPIEEASGLPTVHPLDNPELAQTLGDIVGCLEKALGLLTPRQQRLIELRHQQGCQYDQIAAELGITTGTVGSNIADAERALRRRLSGECKELVEDTVRTSLAGRA
jgi:RNA polymerase sigma factor (sigma-70 family)